MVGATGWHGSTRWRAHGVEGSTPTLFQFSRALFDQVGPTLELGRSFVRAGYQRSHAGLLLLWRGLGELVCQHPLSALSGR